MNPKTAIATSASLLVLLATAAEVNTPEMLAKTGGRVMKPGTQKGEIVCVNCQQTAKREWVEEVVSYFGDLTKFKVRLVDGGEFSFPSPKLVGDATVFVVDDPKLPTLLTAPEDKWAVVSVSKLKTDKEAFFAARVKKETSRAFAFLTCGGGSMYPGNIGSGVAGVSDLDKIVDFRFPNDMANRCRNYMKPFGVTPGFFTTYLSACNHGWAPAPTNDIQRAIWNEVRKLPEKPIKIEFDPKKGK